MVRIAVRTPLPAPFAVLDIVIVFKRLWHHPTHLPKVMDDARYRKQISYGSFASQIAGAISKTCASVIAYPHEVARTRLRQEGSKYTGFAQTISLVYKEEGYSGLYRGLGTQLVRQIPNTAIMMTTYEGIVFMLTNRTSEL